MTIEAAFAICSLLAVLMLGLGSGLAVTTQIRCLDAATEAARLYARGADDSAAEAVRRIAGTGADMDLSVAGAELTVTVAVPLSMLPGIRLSSTAWAMAEPGLADAGPADAAGPSPDSHEGGPSDEPFDAGKPVNAENNGGGAGADEGSGAAEDSGAGGGTGASGADGTDSGNGAVEDTGADARNGNGVTASDRTTNPTGAAALNSETTAGPAEEVNADDPDTTGAGRGDRG
ncbi:TadE family type IV pilus minor pilin [Actinoalloteichus hymeniacidonis]|uniref:TadE family type IV pilus minor pilin n=1 Tax=Actinoalloteichus hymeniacidonis TaxID=340345 RepID=UPI00160F2B79|nr:TadE family type IV pilus minor pilin [Actinoalloteichus hymeniacidonis]MBB5910864.1 hypothetical protein [Actinoalloteichus hymeniacidonis]